MVNLIVAKTKNNCIGNNNKLIAHLKDDLRFFKKITTDNIVVMGRKTYESIGKPLPNRDNYVLSKKKKSITGVNVVYKISDIPLNLYKDVFIIGGSSIYDIFINIVDRMYITEIDAEVNGDAFFPNFDESKWEKKLIQTGIKNEENEYNFNIFEYNRLR